ncbi:MAG: hypothetical protein F4X58_06270 [Chloroflexi bacterium]|nr:hypothetical protein [Chloroflexota bacterium]MYC01508.1 hypothetical protein [Chloroflexota bacterium]
MRNRFVGDVGDFGKYGLLRALCGINPPDEPRLSLAVIWYRNEGKQFDYVAQPEKFADCDPELFLKLKTLVEDDSRTVESIEQGDILGASTDFHHQPVVTKADIVFLDPDKGLAFTDKQRSSRAYADLERANLDSNQTVVIYQSFGRVEHEKQMASWQRDVKALLPVHANPRVLRYRPLHPRAFIILPSRRNTDLIDRRLQDLLNGPWQQHFSEFSSEASR